MSPDLVGVLEGAKVEMEALLRQFRRHGMGYARATRQKVRAIGDVGELAAAMREQQVLRVEDPGDGRAKYVPSHLIAWVEEEPVEERS